MDGEENQHRSVGDFHRACLAALVNETAVSHEQMKRDEARPEAQAAAPDGRNER